MITPIEALKTENFDMYFVHAVKDGEVYATKTAMEIQCANFDNCLQAAEMIEIGHGYFAVEASLRKIGWFYDPETGLALCAECIRRYYKSKAVAV